MELRFEFKKAGILKYISHLDLMRCLTRAFRRANLPFAMTRGFNPKPKISLGPALPVGISGMKEYFDLELKEKIEPERCRKLLNSVLPGELEISSVREIEKKVDSLVAAINRAAYRIYFPGQNIEKEKLEEDFERLFKLQEWSVIRKRRKKKDRKINIKPLVLNLKWSVEGDLIIINVMVVTGSRGNVRAEELISFLSDNTVLEPVSLDCVERRALFIEGENGEGKRMETPIEVVGKG